METILIIFKVIITVGGGACAGTLTIYVFNRIPAKWLCDYNEEPSREMWGVRISTRPWGAVFVLVFAAAALKLTEISLLYSIPGLAAIWLLTQIGIADWKYMIIPDQFVVALAVTAFGFIPFQNSFWSQLLGALAGGGSMLLIGALGNFIFRKETLGFGDVKLMSAVGLVCGLQGTAIVFILAIFSSALVFAAGLISGKLKGSDQRPLGPFIAIGASAYLLFSQELEVFAALF
ncbi:prepilin peptidase [Anoxybacterium hadale]|uniref:Prepilin peptidase n=1 Tax=Anoxybacterium hadale TaxID=3408580 RepID=A0ACD1AE66_9FIRM|nr:prepilin peptidase [Clostridiales bacterium]